MKDFTIGSLAKKAGVGVETVRFYERKKLIKQPARQAFGFRHYTAEDARRIRFIKRAQELGFTLREIGELLKLNVGKGATCAQLGPRAVAKAEEIEKKIQDLRRMKASLARIMKVCDDARDSSNGRAACDCRVVDCFETGRCL